MVNSIIRLFTTVAPDFEILYKSASIFSITQGNTNFPTTLLFYLPIANLNYFVAQNIFTIVSFVFLIFCILVSFKIIKIQFSAYNFLVVFTLLLFAFPTKFTFGMGQSNFVTLLFLLLSYYYSLKNKNMLSGLFLGLLIGYKIVFIYFLIYFILNKKWKILSITLIVYLIQLISVFLLDKSFNLYFYYFNNVLPPLTNFADREIVYNQGLSSFISRIFTDLGIRKIITFVISIYLILKNIFYIYKNKNINLVFSLTIIIFLLIDTFSWQHHFVLLLPCFIILWNRVSDLKTKIALLVSYLLVALNLSTQFFGLVILYIINIKYLDK